MVRFCIRGKDHSLVAVPLEGDPLGKVFQRVLNMRRSWPVNNRSLVHLPVRDGPPSGVRAGGCWLEVEHDVIFTLATVKAEAVITPEYSSVGGEAVLIALLPPGLTICLIQVLQLTLLSGAQLAGAIAGGCRM